MTETPPSQRAVAIATIMTSVAQVMTLLGAAVLGVLVGNEFGAGVATDGFFTANAIYAIVLFVAQSLRTTTVSRLIEGGEPDMERLHEYMLGTAILALGGAAALVAIGLGASPVLVADGAEKSFRNAMLLLAPAAALQLFSGMAAAMLGVYGDYTRAALAFAAGALGNVVGFLLLKDVLGIDGIATALIVGSATSAAVVGSALVARGWRPAGASLQAAGAAATVMLLGAGALIATQVLLTGSVTVAGSIRVGGATIYTYAMMVMVALNAALSSPISIVFAPVVARDWDRAPGTLIGLTMRAYRIGALLFAPAVAFVYLLGQEPTERVLTGISDADIGAIFDLIPVLAVSLLATMLMMIPLVAVFALGKLTRLAFSFGIVAVLHIGASIAVGRLDGDLTALAIVSVCSSAVLAGIAIVMAMREATGQLLGLALSATAQTALVGALCFAIPAVALSFDGDLAEGALCFAIGATAFGAYVATFQRDDVTAIVAMLRR